MLAVAVGAYAIPAKPGKLTVRQPDGSSVTLVLHGDEFIHFTTTSDGYTVIQTGEEWQYAVKENGVLRASGITAHDAAGRIASEEAFLQGTKKMIHADMTAEQKAARARARSLWNTEEGNDAVAKAPTVDYDKFRGLVILVEFSDRSFSRSDISNIFDSMMNTENFGGFYTTGSNPQWMSYTGSVHDYFKDNSMGKFAPKFDVVGPVKISYSSTYPQGTSYAYYCVRAAIEAAKSQIDFSKYDANNDGVVDMFYIVFAGYGSNVQGNNSGYIWPHASNLSYYGLTYNGKRLGRYACSTELGGSEKYSGTTIDGIGTICHEFSHVLGLPDLYDTDYEQNGQSLDPGEWDIMAGAGYLNNARTPAGYSTYERYSSGFMTPELIKEKANGLTLEPLNTSNKAYRINSAVDKEYFLLENRQKTRWDEYLPGHGMLIIRVDSTSVTPWTSNRVNANPEHNYYQMLRAYPTLNYVSGYDAFPGLANIQEINNETEPALKSWTGADTEFSLNTITETDGIISFNVGGTEIYRDVEDFEAMDITSADAKGIKGVFCNWDMTGTRVVATGEGYGTGSHAMSIKNGAFVTSSAIANTVTRVEYDFYNTTNSTATVMTGYSTDGGKTWTMMSTPLGSTQISVSANTTSHISFNVRMAQGSMIRIFQQAGSKSAPCYIDDIKVTYSGSPTSGISLPTTDTNSSDAPTVYYNIAGQRVTKNAKGLVITGDGKKILKN